MIILLIIIIGIISILVNKEYFLNDKMIGYQNCGIMVNTFPTFLKCNYFKNIYNADIKKNGLNINKSLVLTLDNNKKHNLHVNTYKTDKLYTKETKNCQFFIDQIMNSCRFSL